mmetsp:Transcript_46546/g.122923  ORF Transcript_46546/g.122923 Transcript_46546/m.122923 type:complete len:343 (-) Transcript_46546:75-1103(-)
MVLAQAGGNCARGRLGGAANIAMAQFLESIQPQAWAARKSRARAAPAGMCAFLAAASFLLAAYALTQCIAYSPVYRPLAVRISRESSGPMEVANGTVSLSAQVLASCTNGNPYGFVVEDGSISATGYQGIIAVRNGTKDDGAMDLKNIGTTAIRRTVISANSAADIEIDLNVQLAMEEGLVLMMKASPVYFSLTTQVTAKPGFLFISKDVTLQQNLVCGLMLSFPDGHAKTGPIACGPSVRAIDINATQRADAEPAEFIVRLPDDAGTSRMNTLKNVGFAAIIIFSIGLGVAFSATAVWLLSEPPVAKEAREFREMSTTATDATNGNVNGNVAEAAPTCAEV